MIRETRPGYSISWEYFSGYSNILARLKNLNSSLKNLHVRIPDIWNL